MEEPRDMVSGWLRKAVRDVLSLDASTSVGAFDGACLHAQQGAEKFLKADLSHAGADIPRPIRKPMRFQAGPLPARYSPIQYLARSILSSVSGCVRRKGANLLSSPCFFSSSSRRSTPSGL